MLKGKAQKLIRITLASVMMIIALAFVAFASDNLEVHFIDVGQADAALIKCEGHNMLIDGGKDKDSSLIYSYLKKEGVKDLDYIVNTHGDADHVGGIPGAIQLVGSNIGTVLAPYKTLDKERFQIFADKVAGVGKTITVPKTGDTYKLGNASFQILSAGGYGDNESIVLRLKYGNTSFLLAGDATDEQEKAIADSGYEVESDVLKVSHHGSAYSTGYRFLRAVYPDYAVICCGRNNQYGHPTEETLSRLRDEGASVFRTDNNGDIIFYSDGSNLQYSTEKSYDQETNLIPGGYSNSSSETKQTYTEEIETGAGDSTAQDYVLNTNTKKFHYPYCKSVNQMKDKNKKFVTDTRDNIIAQGYKACKNCNP